MKNDFHEEGLPLKQLICLTRWYTFFFVYVSDKSYLPALLE